VAQLVCFGCSLLWRASVHVWRSIGAVTTLDLGKRYNDEFREYLLGDRGFPENVAVWISVARTVKDFICIGPHQHNKTEFYQFEMQLFGIRWTIFVGGRIDPLIRRTYSLRSPENFVILSDLAEALAIEGLAHLYRAADRSRPQS
jgi:hypothetical protein